MSTEYNITDEKLLKLLTREKIDWIAVSEYQKLSEDFIRELQDKVDWDYISEYQKLSEDFIREFQDKVDWYSSVDSWLYKDEAFKKEQLMKTRMYKCFDDYFIAYKAVRPDRYSLFNFQYQYLKDNTYECHADYSDTENSFGLSVWTEKKAKEYSGINDIIVKCKVYYKDVARVICKHDSNKVRCTKITILD